jgi:hypothetical protein
MQAVPGGMLGFSSACGSHGVLLLGTPTGACTLVKLGPPTTDTQSRATQGNDKIGDGPSVPVTHGPAIRSATTLAPGHTAPVSTCALSHAVLSVIYIIVEKCNALGQSC